MGMIEEVKPRQLPGNEGGETFRQYCGLTPHRSMRWKDMRLDAGGVTAQRLYIAIMKHAKPKGAKR